VNTNWSRPVGTVQPSGTSVEPTHTNSPIYQGTGDLLVGTCATPTFTLVDAGTMVYYVPFVGCISDRPECCPWTAALTPVTTTVTVTNAEVTETITKTTASHNPNDAAYPSAMYSDQQVLPHCPNDYYSISGSCCPRFVMSPHMLDLLMGCSADQVTNHIAITNHMAPHLAEQHRASLL
jgi:hypothetical protein